METFCKIDEKLTLALFRFEKTPKYGRWGVVFYTFVKVVPVSLENNLYVNRVETFCKRTHFGNNFGPIQEEKGPRNLGATPYIYIKAPLICLWIKFHGPIVKIFEKKMARNFLKILFFIIKI